MSGPFADRRARRRRARARSPAGVRRAAPRQRRTARDRAQRCPRRRWAPTTRDELDVVAVRYTPEDSGPGAEGGPGRASSARRPGRPTSRSTTPTRWSPTSACAGHSRMRSTASSLADVGESIVIATGGIVPPALQGHTPDIVPAFDPDLARRYLAESGHGGARLTVVGTSSWVPPFLDRITDGWRDVLGIDTQVREVSVQEAMAATADGRPRPDLRHRLAPRLPGPRVLPPAAVPLRQPHERGRLLLPAVRRSGRASPSGAQRPAPGCGSTTTRTGWRSPSVSP